MKNDIPLSIAHSVRRRAEDVQPSPKNVAIFKSVTAQMNLFHGALNALGDGLIALDMHQHVVLWNEWMSKRSLYTTNEAIGRAFIELFPDLKDGRVHGAIRGALQNNLTTLIPDLPEDEPLSLRRQFGEFCPEEEEHYALKVIPFRAGYAPLHCLLHITDISATIARERHLQNKSQELERQSFTDGLTGIANRRHFDLHLKQELGRARRLNEPLSLLMLDVDFFKKYNDRFGHRYGDYVLIEIASILAKSVHRSGDLVARVGGEEFAIVLTNACTEGAAHIAENIRLAIERLVLMRPYACTDNHVTVSLGIATCASQESLDANALFDRADKNLYEAKRLGRNKVFYERTLEGQPDDAEASLVLQR